MSIDMFGWIEIQNVLNDEWVGVVELSGLLLQHDNNKLLHSYIFGAHENPGVGLFNKGGLPSDVSEQVILDTQFGSATWASWAEINAINWKESVIEGRKQKYIDLGPTEENPILTSSYALIFDLMEVLSKYHGESGVRIIVWFG